MFRPSALVAVVVLAVAAGASRAAAQPAADGPFAAPGVQDIRLYVHAADWRALQADYLENTYFPADLLWGGVRVRNVGIRSRGYGSRDPRKPGLKIDMNHFVAGQRFLGLRALILDNGVQDDSQLKERLAFALFERAGVRVAREVPARLYVNNYYWGAYVLVESIDDEFLTRIADSAATEVAYLFEYRWVRPYDFGYLGDIAAYAELFAPRTHETAPLGTLFDPIRELTRRVAEAPDDGFEDAVTPYLDLDQFVRIAAVENFVADIDGLLGSWGMNNFYLYRPVGSTRARLIPWDKDVAFNDVAHPIWFNVETNALMRRAMQQPRLRALYLETLAACAGIADAPGDQDPRGWLERELEAGAAQIAASVEADRMRRQPPSAFRAEVERLRAFAQARGRVVRCEVAAARGDPPADVCEPN